MKHVSDLYQRRREISERLPDRVFSDDAASQLANICGDPEFLVRLDKLVRLYAVPFPKWTKADKRRELEQALAAASNLHRVIDGSVGGATSLWRSGLGPKLREFAAEVRAELEALDAQPNRARSKNHGARDLGKCVADVFRDHHVNVSHYAEGSFCRALQITFQAVNRIRRGAMPSKVEPLLAEILTPK